MHSGEPQSCWEGPGVPPTLLATVRQPGRDTNSPDALHGEQRDRDRVSAPKGNKRRAAVGSSGQISRDSEWERRTRVRGDASQHPALEQISMPGGQRWRRTRGGG